MTGAGEGQGDGSGLDIQISNDKSKTATVITISGPDQKGVLLTITSALNAMNLQVTNASVEVTKVEGEFTDTFSVVDSKGEKVAEDQFGDILGQLEGALSSSPDQREGSTRPIIYGMVAAAEVERLRPLSESNGSGSGSAQLELAAAEMSQVSSLPHPHTQPPPFTISYPISCHPQPTCSSLA
jgi:alpha-amylase